MKTNKYCIANWKMYLNDSEVRSFLKTFNLYNFDKDYAKIVLCPSYSSILTLKNNNVDNNFNIGSQDVSKDLKGAFTGDVSINMLEDINCSYVIVGHSEKRQYHGETNGSINEKLKNINLSKITPIICIGESYEERKNKIEFDVISKQLHEIFDNISIDDNKDLIIAYEPIWAIGSGLSADLIVIEKMHVYIKNIIEKIYPNHCNIYLLYGGSVNEDNAQSIIKLNNVDGFLIGSSSIEPEKFYKIYKQL